MGVTKITNKKDKFRDMFMLENVDGVCSECLNYLNEKPENLVAYNDMTKEDREHELNWSCFCIKASADVLGLEVYCPFRYGVYQNDGGKEFLVHPKKYADHKKSTYLSVADKALITLE